MFQYTGTSFSQRKACFLKYLFVEDQETDQRAGKVLDLNLSLRLKADRLLIRSFTMHGNLSFTQKQEKRSKKKES
jgi:hypothetical protein